MSTKMSKRKLKNAVRKAQAVAAFARAASLPELDGEIIDRLASASSSEGRSDMRGQPELAQKLNAWALNIKFLQSQSATAAGQGADTRAAGGSVAGSGTSDRDEFLCQEDIEDQATEANMRDEGLLEWWRKTNGLHTVKKWCSSYRKHPAGWGALLMIHGASEVTNRVRAKVETNAIYSALFLSATIPTIMEPPPALYSCKPWHVRPNDSDFDDFPEDIQWECEIRMRVFFYSLTMSIALHLLAILLAMSFGNALNETAREADVFRMFARGKGFLATVKVETSFRYGMALDFIAMSVIFSNLRIFWILPPFSILEYYMGYEIVVIFCLAIGYMYRVFSKTSNLLFQSGSIVKYWREELGGKPDEDDPYDLSIPVGRLHSRAKVSSHTCFKTAFKTSDDFKCEFAAPEKAPTHKPTRVHPDNSLSGKSESGTISQEAHGPLNPGAASDLKPEEHGGSEIPGSPQSIEKEEAQDHAVETNLRDESVLEWWKKTSGLHTVLKWCTNYKKHPAGWGALLMIHGVPEVCSRMRSKVETNAMYSALFLSATIPSTMNPPPALAGCKPFWHGRPNDSPEDFPEETQWECEIRARVFFYSITLSIALHLLAILLAMSFCNALDETARDADVYRMFSRGKGFLATVKVENAFRLGILLDFIAMFSILEFYLGWEICAVFVLVIMFMYRTFSKTSTLLFSTASIVKYWRVELGGKPDEDDPYDLSVVVERMHKRAEISEQQSFKQKFGSSEEFHPGGSPVQQRRRSRQHAASAAISQNSNHHKHNKHTGASVAFGLPGRR